MSLLLPAWCKRGIRGMLASPAMGFVAKHYRGLGTCLMYHCIAEEELSCTGFSPNAGLIVSAERFETHMQYISENFPCLSLPAAIKLLREGRLLPQSVIVTFDDGYKGNLTLALPIMEKYKVPATVYVSTGFLDRTSTMWWAEHEHVLRGLNLLELNWRGRQYAWQIVTPQQKWETFLELNALFKSLNLHEQEELMDVLRERRGEPYSYDQLMLSWDELQQLNKSPLITIGAHTTTHPILRLCSQERLRTEMEESRRILQERLGEDVPHLAYPFGTCGEAGSREFETARECGFASAVTTRCGHWHGRHVQHLTALPRIYIDRYDDLKRFKWKLSGCEALVANRGRVFVTE